MIIYSATRGEFSKAVTDNIIDEEVERQYVTRLKRRPPPGEMRAWRNSLPQMEIAFANSNVPEDAGVAIEYVVPFTSKRIDFLISGRDRQNQESLVIVELKQWEKVQDTAVKSVVKTYLGGGIRDVAHPSYQAWSYMRFIKDFNTEASESNIQMKPCSYLHNCIDPSPIMTEFYDNCLELAPLFGRHDVGNLGELLDRHIAYGDSGKLVARLDKGKLAPSKHLIEHVFSLLKGNEAFVLLDDQKLVFECILHLAEKANRAGSRKQVVVVEGGPGTGKSVLAINLLAKILQRDLICHYVTQNSAPREVFKKVLKGHFNADAIDGLFRSPEPYVEAEPNSIGSLIVDEAHRLKRKSGIFDHRGENQIMEIVRAANFSVFFIDEDQRVTSKDNGRIAEIMTQAGRFNAAVTKLKLESQFRCNGSDGYLAWINHALQIRETANPTLDGIDYDFRVFDSPSRLYDSIVEKNNDKIQARMVAGYCWNWVSKKDKTAYDIVFGEFDFRMRWNLVDHGQAWLIQDDSISEVGCIYTCQGLELDYVGVIIGPDLIVRDGEVQVHGLAHAGTDRQFGLKTKLKKKDRDARKLADTITRNIYRTLMTRGQKGCYIYCADKETNEYFKSFVRNRNQA